METVPTNNRKNSNSILIIVIAVISVGLLSVGCVGAGIFFFVATTLERIHSTRNETSEISSEEAISVDELCRRLRDDKSGFRTRNRGRKFLVRGVVADVTDEETLRVEETQMWQELGVNPPSDSAGGELHPLDEAYFAELREHGIDRSRSTVALAGENPKWMVACGFVDPSPPGELAFGRQVVIEGKLETGVVTFRSVVVRLANCRLVEVQDEEFGEGKTRGSQEPLDELTTQEALVGTWRADHKDLNIWLAFVFEDNGKWTLTSSFIEQEEQPTGKWELLKPPNGKTIAKFRSNDGDMNGHAEIVAKDTLVVTYLGGRTEEYSRQTTE